MNSFSLTNHAALVTGSSQGIGFAAANALREAGAKLVFHGLQARPENIPTDSGYVQADLMQHKAPTQLVADAFKSQPNLDTLVCNAGSFFDTPFLEMTRERWDKTLQLNLSATYFIVQEFAKRLVAAKRGGSICITTSTNGLQAEADSTAYDTSKGALVMLIRSLAVSLGDHDIRVNGIAPGLIKTPLTSVWMETRADDLLAHYKKKILLGRIGAPEDCAGAVVFLCSPAASYITGEILTIDGGLTVQQVGKV
ncbi:MAG: SDR family oxidoreductase [Verrucomicrobia bacterium]|nr:SDR family oxidoreductase [Verrucomicrobiota bacterium]